MKITEIVKKYRGMKNEELAKELATRTDEFTLASLKVKVGKESNISLANKLKKDVARIKTIIKEKELGETNE
mgnify:CR=1 FL=1